MSEYFARTSAPGTSAALSSATMRAEFDAIEAGFNKLPVLSTTANRLWFTNSGGTGVGTNAGITFNGTTFAVSVAMALTGAFSVLDSNFSIKDNVDQTKVAQFQLSGITTGQTRTYTLPDASGTLVDLATIQALTNKTINSSVIGGSTPAAGTFTTLASTGNATLGDDAAIDSHAINGATLLSVNSASAALEIRQIGGGVAFRVEDDANPDSTPFVIDTQGKLLLGHATSSTYGGSAGPPYQQAGLTQAPATMSVSNWGNTTTATLFVLSKARSGTIGSHTSGIVNSSTEFGRIAFEASDGVAFIPAAEIKVSSDGTPGTNDMPTRMSFSTTADGAAVVTERVRIDSRGNLTIGFSSASGPALSTTVPARMYSAPSTYTDTATPSGSVAHAPLHSFREGAIAATNVMTYSTASTVYIAGAPTAGSNVTITQPWALYVLQDANFFGGRLRIATTDFAGPDAYVKASVGGATLGAFGSNTSTTSARTHYRLSVAETEVGGLGTVSGDFTFLVGGTERMRLNSSGYMGIVATSRICLDGVAGTGDTYLVESSANVLDLVAGGATTMRLSATAATVTGTLTASGNVGIAATNRLYFDGVALTGDTYIVEGSANNLTVVAGGVSMLTVTATGITLPVTRSITLGSATISSAVSTLNISTGGGAGTAMSFTGDVGIDSKVTIGNTQVLIEGFGVSNTTLSVSNPGGLRVTGSFNSTNSTGTNALGPGTSFRTPTFDASGATTYTVGATVYIEGAPTAGSFTTLTNAYALYSAAGMNLLAGNTRIGGTTAPTVALDVTGAALISTTLGVSGVATLASGTATPAGGSTSARLLLGTTSGFGVYYGSGTPTVSAAQGSIYIRSDGSSTSTRLYVNTNGTTGWTNFTSAT